MGMSFSLQKWARRIEALPPLQFVLGSIAAILVIGVVDHLTGPITSLTIFYLVPVASTAWVVGRAAGNGLALFAALTWAIADRFGPYAEPKALIGYWDDLSMLAVFIVINTALGILRAQLQRERTILQDVQRRLLPNALPELRNFDVAWRWEPAWTVAGDYYDVMVDGDQCAFCVADVSGKGMPAALLMSNVQATVRALSAEGMSPRRVVSNLNEMLFERVRRGSFVTLFYGVLDISTGELTYVNGGHNPPLVCSSEGEILHLQPTGPVAGVIREARYTEETIRIRPGDMLVVYSDGVTEYENAAGEQFGDERLRDAVRAGAARSAEELCLAVFASMRRFGGRMPFNDDVTLVALRSIAPSSGPATPGPA